MAAVAGLGRGHLLEDCDFDFGDKAEFWWAFTPKAAPRRRPPIASPIPSSNFFGTAFGNRGTVKFEIMTMSSAAPAPGGKPTGGIYPLRLCNGTGVVFNNQVHSDTLRSGGLMLDVYRIRGDYTGPAWPGHDPIILAQKCDGGSILDGNLPYDPTAQGKRTAASGHPPDLRRSKLEARPVGRVLRLERHRKQPWPHHGQHARQPDRHPQTLVRDRFRNAHRRQWPGDAHVRRQEMGLVDCHQVVRNLSDGSQGVVNSMTPTTITATLGGGKTIAGTRATPLKSMWRSRRPAKRSIGIRATPSRSPTAIHAWIRSAAARH